MGDVTLSGNALVLVGAVATALTGAIGVLFRLLLASKDAQILAERANTEFWREVAIGRGQQTDQLVSIGRKAARALTTQLAGEANP